MKQPKALLTTLVTCGLWLATVGSADVNGVTAGTGSSESLGGALTPDVRLDAKNSDIQLHPVTGELCAGSAGGFSLKDHPDDVFWDNSISPSPAGVGSAVNAFTVYDGMLIAAGEYYVATDDGHCISAWDGNGWSQLEPGLGLGSRVSALTVYDGK